MKRLSLLAQFSLLSLVVFAIFGVVLGFGLTHFFETQEIDRQKQVTANLMLPAIAPYLNEEIVKNGAYGKDYKALEGAFSSIGGAGLVRVKIWNSEGMVVYSDQQELVGQKYPISDELARSMNGEIIGNISPLTKAENTDERGYGELMEVYTPLVLSGDPKIVGALEGYYDIDDLRTSLDYSSKLLWASIVAGFGALYFSLFAIVRGASQRLIRQSRENAMLLTDTQRKAARLATINELARAINQSSLNLDAVFQTALRGINRIVPQSVGSIAVVDEQTGEPTSFVSMQPASEAAHLLVGVDGWTHRDLLDLGNGNIALCVDTHKVQGPEVNTIVGNGVRSFLSVAIVLGERTLGTLLVVSDKVDGLDEDDAAILKGVADQLAIAIENTRLIKETAETTALRETNRLKDEFVSMVSHELRTPLASIKGYSHTLMCKDGQEWDETTRNEFLSIIADESDKLTDLVENLLEMSRIEAGRLPITPEPVLLSRFCKTVTERVAKHYPSIDFVCDMDEPLPVVEADPRRVEQVLLNLLQNAARYSGSKVVTVRGSYDGGHEVVVSVVDHGKGIAAEHLPSLFDKFYRAEKGSSGSSAGTGLGLAICKALVEAQGGRIWVESTRGKGTTFYFTLPALVMPGEGAPRKPEPAANPVS